MNINCLNYSIYDFFHRVFLVALVKKTQPTQKNSFSLAESTYLSALHFNLAKYRERKLFIFLSFRNEDLQLVENIKI